MFVSPVAKTKKNILITGTGGRSVGSGILHSLVRTCPSVRDRWRVIAGDAEPFAWGLYKADANVLLPYAVDAEYVPRLRHLVASLSIDAIIPGTEAEIEVLLKNKDLFLPAVVIANRLELMPLMLDKFATSSKLRELGYRVIPTVPIREWELLIEQFGFPLIVKPTKGSGGSRGLHIVGSREELLRILPVLDNRGEPCVQPYVGDSTNEYTVGVLSDLEGKVIDSIVMRRKLIGLSLLTSITSKNRQCAVSTGYSQGYIIRDSTIQGFCERLARELDSRGPLNIQLRMDQKTGEPLVFEIHPRFSGTTPIRADVGFNEVDLLLRNSLFSESFGRQDYQSNVAAIRAFEHVIVPMEHLIEKDGHAT